MLDDEINETVLELGVRYTGVTDTPHGRMLKFQIANPDRTKRADINQIADQLLQLLVSAPSEEIRNLFHASAGVVIE